MEQVDGYDDVTGAAGQARPFVPGLAGIQVHRF